jgi:hypothetical protein
MEVGQSATERFYDPRALRERAARLIALATAVEDGTWGVIVDGPGTAESVAEVVGCTAQGANNRLRRLYDLRLIDRETVPLDGGGRQFAYRIAVDADA